MNNQKGAIAILTAILLVVLLGFAALSIDTGYLFASKNELQNAADAGALAGARELYISDGTSVNENSNQIAYDTALRNVSANSPVEVQWTSGNTGDVQRGHWSWGRGDRPRGFTPSDSLSPITLWGVSDSDLDDNLDFINAVQVTARRDVNQITSFFGKIFGIDGFRGSTTAVGYIGFAGSFAPYELDVPIAVCLESVTSIDANGNTIFDCSIGRMINSGNNQSTSNTGGWTDFDQSEECNGVNSSDLTGLMINNCDDMSGNQTVITSGMLETGGGQNQSVYDTLSNCWTHPDKSDGGTRPWKVKLPVVTCPGNNVGTCQQLVGGVTLEILWITGGGEDPHYNDAPTEMESNDPAITDWDGSTSSDLNGDGTIDGEERWHSFVTHFSLKNVDGSPAPYASKSIYFKPSCEVAVPSGETGGENLGVMAEIPVLVD